MSENNLLFPPPLSSPSSEPFELSERGTRLGAVLLDILFAIILGIPLVFIYSKLFGVPFIDKNPAFMTKVGKSLVLTFVDLTLNGYLLYQYGQTLGKRICKIKIIKPDGSVPSLVDSYLKRSFLFHFIQLIPFMSIINLVDALLIFRQSRKCLHDEVANTLVVKAES